MDFWWVNHKQTFRHEFHGGYIWSPKVRKDGARNRYYDFMRLVRPGDFVFSYAFAHLQGIGVAKSHCYTCPRPDEFGHIGQAWDKVGWRVDVQFAPFPETFRPRKVLAQIRGFLGNRDAPLTVGGDGQQRIYLTKLSRAFADVLIDLIGGPAKLLRDAAVRDQGGSIAEIELPGVVEWEEIEKNKIEASAIAETERRALLKSRIGQGRFKENVFRIEHRCRVTGVTNPVHLIASHIKPWRESTNDERMTGANGLLLTPSMDHLFDRGFISFDDSGETLVSPIADHDSLRRMGLDPTAPPDVGSFNVDQRFFLKHHRNAIFLSGVS